MTKSIGFTDSLSRSILCWGFSLIARIPARNVSKDDKEYLIPLIDDVVLEVDQNQEVIIIDPIEGLFI